MAVVEHVSSIKASPLALLKYVAGVSKEESAEIVSGLNCSDDPDSAYLEMSLCYESYSGQKFSHIENTSGKQKIKMHHYVMSFKSGEVTPEKAHSIGEEWAKTIFGADMQVLIATHTDTDNIHVHFAVNAYDMKGRHWIDNKKTLKQCRDISDKLMNKYHLSVIENPSNKHNHKYSEWLARQNGTSWKEKLCDDIDRIVLMESVRSIDDLIKELKNSGYEVTQHKYLSVKPTYLKNRKPIRTLRLGDGYGFEELQYRIENKDKEMTLDKVLSYSGVQRDYALCLRSLQITFYRQNRGCENISYYELRRNADLLCYVHEHNIHSKEDFDTHVNSVAAQSDEVIKRYKSLEKRISDYEYILKNGNRYIELINKPMNELIAQDMRELSSMQRIKEYNVHSKEDLDKVSLEFAQAKSELADMQGEYEKAVAEKKAAGANYKTFIRQLESDYERILYSARKELAEYEDSLPEPEQPKKEFKETVLRMRDWADKVIAKSEERDRIVAEQRRAEERCKRDYYNR